ncbi:MAG: TIGR04182 family glycosyltransferase, partial [Halobacteriaceae archaeon]
EGFEIETEMSVECAKIGLDVVVVPIHYKQRPSGSHTNLKPFRHGGIILLSLYRLAKTNNPLFYFGTMGTALLLLGGVVGVYVGVEWVTQNVSHEVLAVLSAMMTLIGVQLLIFGLLSDLIVTLHRERRRRE